MSKSWTTTSEVTVTVLKRAVHPGEILSEELQEWGVSVHELARQMNVPADRVGQIIAGSQSVTADTALRLGHWFGVDAQFWMNLQSQYDLALAERSIGADLQKLPSAAQA